MLQVVAGPALVLARVEAGAVDYAATLVGVAPPGLLVDAFVRGDTVGGPGPVPFFVRRVHYFSGAVVCAADSDDPQAP